MKRLFERSCPRHDMDPLLGHGLCFPSGHTSGAVVAYGMLAYVLMRILPQRWHLPVLMSTTTLIFTVGCSRVFVHAHFPSDVLAGFASGIAWLALVVVFTESWLRGWRPGVQRHDPARQAAPIGEPVSPSRGWADASMLTTARLSMEGHDTLPQCCEATR